MAIPKTLDVNGRAITISIDDPEMPLLYALRDNLALHGPRFGCGLGQCGACTVHVDGRAVRSCITPLSSIAASQKVVTLEGLGTPENPHPLQTAWIAEDAMQCGYCMNGWIMTAAALLRKNPHPSDAEIRESFGGLKCRCGAHMAVIRAVKRAADAA